MSGILFNVLRATPEMCLNRKTGKYLPVETAETHHSNLGERSKKQWFFKRLVAAVIADK